jgi:proliferating cell nuclear antigen
MEFRTIQGSVIRNLFESIKEILTDVNLIFNNQGMRCTAIDGNKIACVFFKLDADKFEYFSCADHITVGVNMQSLFKLIKTVTNNDTISMSIQNNEKHKLRITIENTDKHTRTMSILKLLDIDQEIITIPDINFDHIITIPCSDFQKYCKDMMTISHIVTMACKKDMFILSCSGDFADQIIEIEKCNTTNSILEDENVDVTGNFSLKYINLFIKSSSLCSTVEIFLKKQYPLILVYRVGSLGKIQYCLAPSI